MKLATDHALKAATLDDVAALAGVTRMAVSVVLNGSKSGTRVSQAKREAILAAAKTLHYRPNLVAKSLARRATHIFGFYSGFDYLDVRNPFIGEITAGLLEACSVCRRDLLLHTIFRGHNINNLHDELVSGKIDGLVIWAPEDDPLAALLRDSHLPVVSIVESIPPFPSVTVEDYAGSFEIGRFLFEKGHRCLIYWTQRRPSASRRQRLKAIQDAAIQFGLDLRLVVDPTANELLESLNDSGTTGLRPTALACWNDMVALQALAICRRAGISVPADVSITGFDGIRSFNELDICLTSVSAPWSQVASIAISHLVDLTQGKEVPLETVLPVHMIQGETA
jgi:LacI family transcriptional regulator